MAFIIREKALLALRLLKPIIEQIRRRDPNLADQMQRAGQSTYLNIAEGQSARGRNEAAKLQIALTECKEARAALEVAVAWAYVAGAGVAEADAALDEVAAMLWCRIFRPGKAA